MASKKLTIYRAADLVFKLTFPALIAHTIACFYMAAKTPYSTVPTWFNYLGVFLNTAPVAAMATKIICRLTDV